ncbi:MAG: cyclophane-forming radical SAM/SPASM peptide maturase GrrM/OscB [Crocosphaera sp.]
MKSIFPIETKKQLLNIDQFAPVRLVVIQSTSFCNLNCDYCYLPDRHLKSNLSLELIYPIFEKILTSPFIGKSLTVCWHLGEPLAVSISFYEEALKIINEVKKNINNDVVINYSIQTNGLFLTQAWCDFFKKHHFHIGVSLDGPAFIHDTHRKTRKGGKTHQATMNAINLLHKNKLDFYIIAVLTETSLDYPDEIFTFFKENGINQVGFNIEEVEGVNRTSSLQNRNIKERIKTFWQKFWQLSLETNGALQVREFEIVSESIFKGGRNFINQMSYPFSIISIDNQGNFSTYSPELLTMKSIDYGDFILGNLLHDTLESVCHSDKFIRLYEDITKGVDMCQENCQYFKLCGGGAPSNKYWENDTFISSETMACQYNKQLVVDVVLEGLENHLGLNK